MDVLTRVFEQDIAKIDFYERKEKITNTKTILYGPPRSGKSYIAYEFLFNFTKEKRLYIDLDDLRINIDTINNHLQAFIDKNQIEALVIDSYNSTLTIPNIANLILISQKELFIEGFDTKLIMPLDFEEFLSQDLKLQNITTSFNNFFRFGNFSESIPLNEHNKIKRNQEVLRLFSKDEVELLALKTIINSIGELTSVHNLYTQLKRVSKVSKDRFYTLIKSLEEQKILFFVAKENQEKALKRLYLYNHSIKSSVSFAKNFKNEFTNMVFLELFNTHKDISYLDGIDFYLPLSQSVILCIPFYNDMMVEQISQKLLSLKTSYKIKKLTIICVNNTQSSFCIDDIECNIIPFFVWALL